MFEVNKKPLILLFTILFFFVLISGCSFNANKTRSSRDPSKQNELPEYLVFPNSEIINSSPIKEQSNGGILVILKTKESVSSALNFYKVNAIQNDLTIKSERQTANGTLLILEKKGKVIATVAIYENEQTKIAIEYYDSESN